MGRLGNGRMAVRGSGGAGEILRCAKNDMRRRGDREGMGPRIREDTGGGYQGAQTVKFWKSTSWLLVL